MLSSRFCRLHKKSGMDPGINEDEAVERSVIQEGLDKLAGLCKVLNLDYKEKLQVIGELGEGVAEVKRMERIKSLHDTVSILERTKKDRFSELLDLGIELIEEWKYTDLSVNKMLQYAPAFALTEVAGPDDVTEAKALSQSLLMKVSDAIKKIKFAKNNKVASKYMQKKTKLIKMLAESHIILGPSVFDPKKEVASSDLPAETKEIKRLIKEYKPQVLLRRETILRVLLLEKAVKSHAPLVKIDGMIKLIKDLNLILESNTPMMYDGLPIDQALALLRDAAQVPPANSQKKKLQEESRAEQTSPRMTRSRCRLGTADRQHLSNTPAPAPTVDEAVDLTTGTKGSTLDTSTNPIDLSYPRKRRSNIAVPAPPAPAAPPTAHISLPTPPAAAPSPALGTVVAPPSFPAPLSLTATPTAPTIA